LKPKTYTIPLGSTSVTKTVRVKVGNADILPTVETAGHAIQLSVTSSDCPVGIAGTPDFGKFAAGPSNVAQVVGGKRRTAKVALTITSAGFLTFNHKAPKRCTLTFTASPAGAQAGSVDPTPENAVATLELNIIDKNDTPEGTARFESVIKSINPAKVTLRDSVTSKTKNVKPTVINADILPGLEPSAESLTVTACPTGTVGVTDFYTAAGAQNTALLTGGQTKQGTLPLTINASAFLSPNKKSPARCTAVLTVTGPGGDSDGSNNTTKLVIDVTDKNDF